MRRQRPAPLRRRTSTLALYAIAIGLGILLTLPASAQTLDFALPDAGPPTAGRGTSPTDIPLTDEGPRIVVPDPVEVAPPPPPPPVRDVTTPRFRDARLRQPAPDLSGLSRLRFLSVADFEPFTFLDREGRPVGYHVDLAREICNALDITERCQFQILPFGQLEGALARGEGEAILAGIRPTREARETLAFSDPYMRFPARFVTRRGSGFDPDAADGARVGVVRGTAHEAMLRTLFPALTPVPAPSVEALERAVSEEAVDAGFADGATLAGWLASPAGACCGFRGGPYLSEHFLGTGLTIAVAADDPELLAALEWALAQAESSGALDEAYLRAFPIGFF